ncbi:hypothetical protein FRAAL3651 [Frankia alni ACN14a]|uniref:Uncharacterized protein n=1 Tax=Frankia alni (strain DSM 45986 / CECT 9034 / ACN14a) TaxID=326424 RepID=Q0RJL8_FRAAA|nr:hypothetical protein FRAAL3651 [Frankia alni ACN14a]
MRRVAACGARDRGQGRRTARRNGPVGTVTGGTDGGGGGGVVARPAPMVVRRCWVTRQCGSRGSAGRTAVRVRRR